ncbi:CYTH domain-containing protein, partial [candidate division KSB1 bacterium]|nr:CYTH domain-containing protein [Gammaproteobacteria bacterium]NIR52561.1 CYTH domain-containing protein [candidate division KSB1 bacterium]NIS27876.1 CYTH domain-containing protein [candidate division KSB1 bacterium]NIT74757.1 CYTH domain-containing protein [candidate division KSB1 bacterium]NIU28536.1 CYTH domain-containing protein [candidate division KSB1 bacterium]
SPEIERKFLVKKTPEDLHDYPHQEISQGYIAITDEGVEVRLRNKTGKFTQAVKSGGGLKRLEVEIELSRTQFERLWPLTEGKRVQKVRYEIDYKGWTIELDVYEGRLNGLTVAEVEFDNDEQSRAFEPPDWLGKEITNDERYKNRNLAVYGLPEI